MASSDKHEYQSPLGRARGLGASHHGAGHWWHERLTSIAAVPLTIWFVCAAVCMPSWSYESFTTWLAAPVNAVLMILSVLCVFYHAALGCQVIAEDYIHTGWMRRAKVTSIHLFFTAAAVACIFSVLKIAL